MANPAPPQDHTQTIVDDQPKEPAMANPAPPQDHTQTIVDAFPRLRRFLSSKTKNAIDAQDLAQDTIATFLDKLRSGTQVEHPRRFLFGIANNKAMQYWSRRAPAGEFDSGLHSVEQLSTTMGAKLDRRNKVVESLRSLSLRQQQVIELRYGEGFTLEEVAEVTALSLATVKRALQEALERLRARASLTGTDEDVGVKVGAEYRKT